MALSTSSQAVTSIAGEALTIYRYVSLQTDGKFDISGAAEEIDGICGMTVAADLDAFPRVIPNGGTCKVEAGAAITLGDKLESDSTGRAITHTTGVGDGTGGTALTAAGAAGDIIDIIFLTDLDEA